MMGTPRWSSLLITLGLIAGQCQIAKGAGDQPKIKLLSDEAADACIQDVDCLQDLFLRATLGEDTLSGDDTQRLFKWVAPVRIANITGRRLPRDLRASVDQALQQISLIAGPVGVDFDLVVGGSREIVNLILLVSDDFDRDRSDTFSELLSTVLAGRDALYSELSSGKSPICQNQLFADHDGLISGGLGMAGSNADETGLRRCIHQITLKALGLRHPLPDHVDSVLNPEGRRDAWTSIDYVLLKLLYDPLTGPGMSLEELTRIFPQIYQKALRPSS